MKKIVLLLFTLLPVNSISQTTEYTLTSFLDEGIKAPNTHHLGDAWLNFLVQASEQIDYNITQAKFSANSTLDWHKHETPQIIIVLEGVGYYQERGKNPILMKVGDVINCEEDTEHWHSSSVDHDVTYLAIYGNEQTEWTEVISRDYYNTVAQRLNDE